MRFLDSMNDSTDQYEAELSGFPVVSESSKFSGRDPLEILVAEYSERKRQGQPASIEEYAEKYPDLADEIRELFPMVAAMEKWKQGKESDSLRQNVPETLKIDRLGDCRIVRELARGGMGIVLEAQQDSTNRRVAVKMLPWRSDYVPEWKDQFQQEAKTLAKLRHPNIVPLLSFGEYRGFCYYVMPFITGVGLNWIVDRFREKEGVVYADEIAKLRAEQTVENQQTEKKRSNTESAELEVLVPADPKAEKHRSLSRQSWKKFATIALQIASGLRYAHSQGVLHNDIKPANILLDAEGRVWITDFGLAQPIDREAPEVGESIAGTLRYMAPERLSGDGDARSDIYSLGVTLYELLTLSPIWEETDHNKLAQLILDSTPLPPREVNPKIPRELEAIILKAINGDLKSRYQSASEMAADLLRYLKGQPISAPKISRIKFFFRNLKRRGRSE